MKDSLQNAFDEIHADAALLEKTAAALRAEREKRARQQPKAPRRYPRAWRLGAALAAALVLAVGAVWGGRLYFTPAAYVSIDINPSVELTLNRMDRVIGAYAFNAEGAQLLQQNSMRGKTYGSAVAALISSMEESGYLREGALLSLTVQAADSAKEQALCDALRQAVQPQTTPAPASSAPASASAASPTQTDPAQAGAQAGAAIAGVEVFAVSAEVRASAHGCHMSPAKYLAVQELLEVDETATLEQYADTSIQQIRQRTQQCREAHGSAGNGGKGHANGHGGAAQDGAAEQSGGTEQAGDASQSGGGSPSQSGGQEHGGNQGHSSGHGHGGSHRKSR